MRSLAASLRHALWQTATGRGIRVGVIDSGWDFGIQDARVERGIGLVSRSAPLGLHVSDDDQDTNGHGTACADIVLQVARDATVVPIRVFGSRLETSPGALIAALHWAAEHEIDVVNLSLGTHRTDTLDPLYSACAQVARNGVILVAAASGRPEDDYPSIFDCVIRVGQAIVYDRFAITASHDSAVEFGARATRQRARGLGGREVEMSGTSVAAPVVTGHVARILERFSGLDVDGIRQVLREHPP